MWRQGLDQLRSGVRDFSQSALLEARQTLQEVGWRQACAARKLALPLQPVKQARLLWFELARARGISGMHLPLCALTLQGSSLVKGTAAKLAERTKTTQLNGQVGCRLANGAAQSSVPSPLRCPGAARARALWQNYLVPCGWWVPHSHSTAPTSTGRAQAGGGHLGCGRLLVGPA